LVTMQPGAAVVPTAMSFVYAVTTRSPAGRTSAVIRTKLGYINLGFDVPLCNT